MTPAPMKRVRYKPAPRPILFWGMVAGGLVIAFAAAKLAMVLTPKTP